MDKKKMVKNNPIGYVIPQMADNDVGLRNFEKKFKGSDFVSPLFGFNVKDELSSPKSEIDNNVRSTYEPYRSSIDKQISNAELLAKYGTIYPEYAGVESFDAPIAKKEVVKQEVVREENVNINFDIKGNNDFPETYTNTNNYNNNTYNNYQEVKPVEEKEVRSTSFDNVNFNQPKEDYSSRDTALPPFLAQSRSDYVAKEEPRYEEPMMQHVQQVNRVEEVKHTPEIKVELKPVRKSVYKLPPLSLLAEPNKNEAINLDFLQSNKEIINNTLSQFNINGEVTNLTHGPSVSRYEISLAPGINVKKVTSITDNLRMYLSAKTLRIQAPIPGKSTIGIEVPNRKPTMVHFVDLVREKEFMDNKKPLRIAVGKNIDNEIIYQDIAKMPHGLIAGGTGSGKSVFVNTLLISLLLKNTPEDLRLILIDPKFVELGAYNDIPHLLTPVINDAAMASKALKWAVDEMQRRYLQMQATGSRNLEEYNDKCQTLGHEKMSLIVIIIDELADLMSACASEVEESIQRITQKARAAGMHIIVATQRPSTDIVKGTIKVNIPTRIAFRVSSAVDSMTILDQSGADNLLGNGDMLVRETEGVERIQGAYISGNDITAVTSYIRENNETNYVFTHDHLKAVDVKASTSDSDDIELLHSAALFFVQNQTCSINALQKQFNLGFNKSQRVVDQLEKYGVVSGKMGTLSREVLLTEEQVDELFNK